jgi:hypothetical protein
MPTLLLLARFAKMRHAVGRAETLASSRGLLPGGAMNAVEGSGLGAPRPLDEARALVPRRPAKRPTRGVAGASPRIRWALAWPAAGLLALGCGTHPDTFVDTVPRGSPVPSSPADSGGLAPRVPATRPVCGPEAKLIYVLDADEVLHSFDPSLLPSPLAFQTIGPIDCAAKFGAEWGAANSMAIDHLAVAWVTDHAGHLARVSTTDGSCSPTTYRPGQPGLHFDTVGMGFAGDVDAGTETLYVSDDSQGPFATTDLGLATIDVTSLRLTGIGPFDGTVAGRDAELTGTGDGRLYGFFPGSPSLIAQIDPTSGHVISSVDLPGVAVTSGGYLAYAFSFWGGTFYTYLASGTGTTDVAAYDPSSGTTTTVLSQIGFSIIGAGVSTCAPTAPPR